MTLKFSFSNFSRFITDHKEILEHVSEMSITVSYKLIIHLKRTNLSWEMVDGEFGVSCVVKMLTIGTKLSVLVYKVSIFAHKCRSAMPAQQQVGSG